MKKTTVLLPIACIAITCGGWAQTVNLKQVLDNRYNSLYHHQVCVDADCHDFDVSSQSDLAEVPNADAYFSAMSYVTLSKLISAINAQTAALVDLKTTSAATNALVAQQINTFNQDLSNSINARCDQLPQDLANSDVIKQLKADILKQVDDKLAALKAPAPPNH